MPAKKTLTFVLMDPPYENARTTTALRLMDIAVRRGFDINVFAYEGAVFIPFAKQTPHANAVHGRSVEEEDHPVPKDWVSALYAAAEKNGAKIDWIQCGLCVDERGVGEAIEGPVRGSPADFFKAVEQADNTLVIPTR